MSGNTSGSWHTDRTHDDFSAHPYSDGPSGNGAISQPYQASTTLAAAVGAHASGGVVTVGHLWEADESESGFPLPDSLLSPPRTFSERLVQGLEMLLAAVALLATSPIYFAIWAIIRLDSPGPAVFRQKRVGIGGRTFRFYKFRTLYVDARERFPELYAYRYSPQQLDNLYFKVENDPRVTRVGKWLRKSTLDELPNLFNVLKGEVALVGPRPEIPEMLKYYKGESRMKFSVRPGVTGLAQVCGRGNLKFFETLHYDLEYVKTRNPWLDLKIIFKTVILSIKRDGAF